MAEGRRISEQADGRGVPVRLLGGIPIWLRSSDGVGQRSGVTTADTAIVLLGHEPADGDGPGLLNLARLAEVCGKDWGFYVELRAHGVAIRHAIGRG